MNYKEEQFEQLQRFYALWREENAMYDDWAKEQGLSSSSALILYSLYEAKEKCTQKSISQMWSIPKQTVNTILKDFSANGYIELLTDKEDKRNKLITHRKARPMQVKLWRHCIKESFLPLTGWD